MTIDIRSLVPGQTKAGMNKSEKSKKKDQLSRSSSDSNSENDSDDSVSLTGKASQISQLIQQMKSSPVVDPSRVAPVKEKVAKGEYEVEYQRVADKMLDFESSYQSY